MEFKAFKTYSADEICVLYTLAKVEKRSDFITRMTKDGKIKYLPRTKTYEIVDTDLKNYFDGIDMQIKEEKDSLARKLMDIFPKGDKKFTSTITGKEGRTSWRGSIAQVNVKLDKMFKFNGAPIEEELLLEAAKQYVDSFKNDTTYMQVLPYFLLKLDKNTGEIDSTMLKCVENIRNGIEIQQQVSDDWTSSMV